MTHVQMCQGAKGTISTIVTEDIENTDKKPGDGYDTLRVKIALKRRILGIQNAYFSENLKKISVTELLRESLDARERVAAPVTGDAALLVEAFQRDPSLKKELKGIIEGWRKKKQIEASKLEGQHEETAIEGGVTQGRAPARRHKPTGT